MTDLNKLRSEFEATPEIKAILEVMTVKFVAGFYVSVGFGIEIYTPYNALLNLAWDLWQEKAKAQAVPEWISVEDCLPDEGNAVLFIDRNNIIHDGYLNTDYVDGPYGENGEDFGDDQTLWASNSNGDEFLLNEIKYWRHRPSSPSASESGAEG